MRWLSYPFSFVSRLFRASQKEYEWNFDNPNFKHMDVLRNSVEQSWKMVQSLIS